MNVFINVQGELNYFHLKSSFVLFDLSVNAISISQSLNEQQMMCFKSRRVQ